MIDYREELERKLDEIERCIEAFRKYDSEFDGIVDSIIFSRKQDPKNFKKPNRERLQELECEIRSRYKQLFRDNLEALEASKNTLLALKNEMFPGTV